jgi:hypothetical protein
MADIDAKVNMSLGKWAAVSQQFSQLSDDEKPP